jgi:hypothetical protein
MSPEQPLDAHQTLEKEPQLHKYFKAAIKTHANDRLEVQPPKLPGATKNTTRSYAARLEELLPDHVLIRRRLPYTDDDFAMRWAAEPVCINIF